MSDNYIWQPMGPMEYVCQCPDCGVPGVRRRQIYVNTWAENYIVGICDPDNGNDNRHVVLPNDLRLCRRVPAPAPVPVDASVREAIEIVIGRSGEVGPYQQTRRTLLDACARIEDWLAGLPEQEAGHD